MNSYEIKLENDKLLAVTEFVKFCTENSGKSILLYAINEGHCLRFSGVYDILDTFKFEHVKIVSANALEYHPVYEIESSTWCYWLDNISNFDSGFDYSWTGTKRFGCIYGRPSAQRLGIAAQLAYKHKDLSFIRTKFDFSTEDTRKLFDIQRLFSWDSSAVNHLELLNNPEFYASYDYSPGNHNTGNLLNYDYTQFLIDIVSEPCCKGNAFYPTEKIVRAMLCKHPFIAMTNKNYLIYLRQLGFKTFYEFWDEDYDGIDGKDRYLHILRLVDTLAAMDEQSFRQMYLDMTEILNHNYQLALSRQYTPNIIQVND
jgi:hypothetical protein